MRLLEFTLWGQWEDTSSEINLLGICFTNGLTHNDLVDKWFKNPPHKKWDFSLFMGDRESSRDLRSQSYQAHLSDIIGKWAHLTQVRVSHLIRVILSFFYGTVMSFLVHLTPLEDSWHSLCKPMRQHGSKDQVGKIVSLELELLTLTASPLSPHFTCRMIDAAHTRLWNNMTQMFMRKKHILSFLYEDKGSICLSRT